MPSGGKGSFKDFLWNSDEKKFLGRTGTNWLKISVFYVIFYACLLAFWALCLLIFLETINYREPKWKTNSGSIIGGNPGLGFRPRPPADNIESTLINFNFGAGENWQHWVDELANVTKSYETANTEKNSGSQLTTCDYDNTAADNQYCDFAVELLGDQCTKEKVFGYEEGRPCIIIKLNKIYDWLPQTYDTVDQLPDDMPQTLKDTISRDFADGSGQITKQNVWISCEGEHSGDVENIGLVNYYPHPGMPIYYYPYTNVLGYKSPLVAVQFSSVTRGVLVNVECKAWAKNIVHDRKERRGSVHLELLVD